ncbi:MAG TPA: hypothetical protein VJ873_02850 [bacterium]|nr:hypothetical protein [bacterium]
MRFIRKISQELFIFLKQCWFLVVLLAVAFLLYSTVSHQNEVVLWCALSYISSFVFYVLTIYLPDRRNRKNINRVVIPYVQNIISDTKGIFYTFLAASSYKCDIKNVQETDFYAIFQSINPSDRSTRLDFLGFVNWFQYLEHQKNHIKHTVDRIVSYKIYLDTDFIFTIESLYNSTFFEILDFIENKPIQYKDFGFLTDAYYQCYQQMGKLEEFLKKHMPDL